MAEKDALAEVSGGEICPFDNYEPQEKFHIIWSRIEFIENVFQLASLLTGNHRWLFK